MRKPNQVIVNLPHVKPTVLLSKGLADTLELVIRSGPKGVNTLELQEAGICSAHNNLSSLRRLGAIIETFFKAETDRHGNLHKTVGHYVYRGWRAEEYGA